MSQNAVRDALGALKLFPLHLNHPNQVSRAQVIGAAHEAASRLEALPPAAVELAEAWRAVADVLREGDTAYVTPTTSPERPFGAVVVDAKGQLVASRTGKTIEGLAELIRLSLPPLREGARA